MQNNYPCARRSALVVQAVDTEVLVFDKTSDKANVLNQTAALVWQECDGESSVKEIAARVSHKLGAPVDEKLVWYTLDQLSDKNLLEERVSVPANARGWTRREFIRAGLVGAAVVLPVIVTITAPTPAHAQSGTGCCVCNNGSSFAASDCATCLTQCAITGGGMSSCNCD